MRSGFSYRDMPKEKLLSRYRLMLPKRRSRRPIYEGNWINLNVDEVELPSGVIFEEYHQLEYPIESIVILLLDRTGKICFIKSRRYSIQKILLELPAGRIEKDEDACTAGNRELEEETGLTSDDLELVFFPLIHVLVCRIRRFKSCLGTVLNLRQVVTMRMKRLACTGLRQHK